MKRWPLVATFVLFIALCISAAYWAMQLFKPPLRTVAAPPQAMLLPPPRLEAAEALFGRRQVVTITVNFQLKGVVVAADADESVAILAAGGKPAKAVRVNGEVMPGVRVQEVHPRYVLLSEGGAVKRVELPQEQTRGAAMTLPAPVVQRAPPPPEEGSGEEE